MEPVTKKYDVGVIVARFQIDMLHTMHHGLIETAEDRHDKVIVVLGVSTLRGSTRDPLPYEARSQMIREFYPDTLVLPLGTFVSDEVWSNNLDTLISAHISPRHTAVLYGGRDSFIPYYSGRFDTIMLDQQDEHSATSYREKISRQIRPSRDFRAGVIFAAYNRYPTCYPAVDVAVFNGEGMLLLARKPGEKLLRFIGGFADPSSNSYEADARREVAEETGIEITDPIYVGSHLVDDWRYRDEPDKIKTLLFRATLLFGMPKPQDDIAGLTWVAADELQPSIIVPEHRPLLELLRKAPVHV